MCAVVPRGEGVGRRAARGEGVGGSVPPASLDAAGRRSRRGTTEGGDERRRRDAADAKEEVAGKGRQKITGAGDDAKSFFKYFREELEKDLKK